MSGRRGHGGSSLRTRPLGPAGARGAAALACAAALLAGCGGEPEPIRPGTAERLQDGLDTVAQLIASGQCRRVQYPLERLDRDVGNLPDEVDGDVRQALDDGVARLAELADEECRQQQEAREQTTTESLPETTTTTTTTPETTTTEPETTTTEPETTDTTTTTTPEPTTTEPAPTPTTPPPTGGPPGNGKGNGGGNGKGNGGANSPGGDGDG